jgi:hypothetical protein
MPALFASERALYFEAPEAACDAEGAEGAAIVG